VASKPIAKALLAAAVASLRYYVCNRRRPLEAGGSERACPQPSTRAEELDALVWQNLSQALLRPDLLLKGEAILKTRTPQPADELLTIQLERLDRRLRQTEGERRRIVDLYQMEAIDPAEFGSRYQEVISRQRRLQQERDELVSQRQLAAHNRLKRPGRCLRRPRPAGNREPRFRATATACTPTRGGGARHWIGSRDPRPHPPRRAATGFRRGWRWRRPTGPPACGVQSFRFASTWLRPG
jgi:hypothetical protein